MATTTISQLNEAENLSAADLFLVVNGGTTKNVQLSSLQDYVLSSIRNSLGKDTNVRALTGNWENTYTTVEASKADWNSLLNVRSLTGSWQSAYTTVQTNSATWDTSIDSAVRSLTGSWQDTYNNFNAQTANNVSVYSTVNAISANLQNISTVVQTNSALWGADPVDAAVRNLTGVWQDTSTFVQTNSSTWGTGGSGGSESVFLTDLQVSLPNGKTFGRYVNGAIIPSTGKTPLEVITMATSEPMDPTAAITPQSSTTPFNQNDVSNVLNLSYTINSLGATIAANSGRLEWRRNNAGTWTLLSAIAVSPATFTHNVTDTAYNTQPFNYRYIVADTAGASITATNNVSVAAYTAPSMSLNVAAVTLAGSETNTNRERGNNNSTISGTITKNNANVPLVSYAVEFRVNGAGSWTEVPGLSGLISNNYTIPSTTHSAQAAYSSASTIEYRIKVVDQYKQSLGSQDYSSTNTTNYNYYIFYGPASSAPGNSAAVRALPSKGFTGSLANPFTLDTGSTLLNFVVALPNAVASRDLISSVIDLDALNANITNSYIKNSFSVNDFAGNGSVYNVYVMTQGVAYSSSHRHSITTQ